MTYAIYNLETKVLLLKLELYSNSQPHHPNPNTLRRKILNLFQKKSIPLDLQPKFTFKSLYQIFLKTNPNPLLTTNSYSSHTLSCLILFKPRPSLFSNFEKEIAFRTAYKGYAWGCFYFEQNFPPSNPNDLLYILCFSSLDDPQHLFYECPLTKQLISLFKRLLFEIFKKPILS